MGPQRPLANFGDPVFFILFLLPPWKEVVKLRWWHACTWLQNITSKQCSHWVGAYRQQTYLMLLLDVQSPDGEPGLESRDAGNIYYLHCTPLVLISWVGMGYPCLRSTTRYYPLGYPLSSYVRPPIQVQHTDEHTNSSRHHPLSKSQHTPLLRSPAVELTLNGIHNNFPQSYTTSSSPLIYAIQIQNKVPGTWSDWFSRVFFIIKNTT